MRIALVILIVVASLFCSQAQARELGVSDPQLFAKIRNDMFVPLFRAMKSGDVATISSYFGGREYERYRVLLEQNQGYPQYLRDYYAGAVFTLDKITELDNEYIAEVSIRWDDGRRSVVQLRITPSTIPTTHTLNSATPSAWKIQGEHN